MCVSVSWFGHTNREIEGKDKFCRTLSTREQINLVWKDPVLKYLENCVDD